MQRLSRLIEWIKWSGFVIVPPKRLMILLTLLLLTAAITLAYGQEFNREEPGQKLNLDIYLYETGKALVTGYIEEPRNLLFLKPTLYTTMYSPRYISNYKYENDTHQLYAWTDALTMKRGENWSLVFSSRGFYNEYHAVFHMPANLRLGKINSSKGLDYLVSASNDSMALDAQGYNIRDPAISVEYRQIMVIEDNNGNNSSRSSNTGFNPAYYLLLIVAFITASGFVFLITRRKDATSISKPQIPEAVKSGEISSPGEATAPEADEKAHHCDEGTYEASALEEELSEDSIEDEAGFDEMLRDDSLLEGVKKIEISSEMKAVMDALTNRERSIMEALIKHGGRMIQAEIRYETGLPRSSLTMVLISLERRNLITKKEWGRTNVIELSESFFSKNEPS